MWLEKEKKKARKLSGSSSQVTPNLPPCEAAQRKPRQPCRLVGFGVAGSARAVPLACARRLYRRVPSQRLKAPAPLFCLAAETCPQRHDICHPATCAGQKQPGTDGRLLPGTAGGRHAGRGCSPGNRGLELPLILARLSRALSLAARGAEMGGLPEAPPSRLQRGGHAGLAQRARRACTGLAQGTGALSWQVPPTRPQQGGHGQAGTQHPGPAALPDPSPRAPGLGPRTLPGVSPVTQGSHPSP